MENVDAVISKDGKTLTITVDLSVTGSPSASGKTQVLATSRGNQTVAGDIKLGINVYKPRG